jgi:phage gp16-like protein
MIHLGAKDLVPDADDYRAMLHAVIGLESCEKATDRQLDRVIEHLKSKGVRFGNKKYSPRSAHKAPAEKTQFDKMRAMWIHMANAGVVRNGSETALQAFAKRQTRIGRLEWLDGASANKVIEALKDWGVREGVVFPD